MAAPGDSPTVLCAKCFATVERGAPFCPECGIPMSSSDGSDGEIYPMLARANLLRMRAEYKQAEDVCLKILKRFPNNSTANTLLGDICAERGDLEHAAQWYEMALDLSPDSQVDREKLAAVKQRIHDRDTAATAAQIGIPVRKGSPAIPAVLAALLIVAVGAGAYFFGANTPKPDAKANVVDVSGGGGVVDPGTQPIDKPAGQSEALPWIDAEATARVKNALADQGVIVLDAWEHPLTRELLVTINAEGQSDVRRFAAVAGGRIIEKTGAPSVTVRAVQAGLQVFVGKVGKAELDALIAAVTEGQDPYAALDAADRLLSPGEWPAKPASGVEETTTTGGETARGGTTGAEATTTGATTGG